MGDSGGSLNYFENTGTSTAPAFVDLSDVSNPLEASFIQSPDPTFADIDGDGKLHTVSIGTHAVIATAPLSQATRI